MIPELRVRAGHRRTADSELRCQLALARQADAGGDPAVRDHRPQRLGESAVSRCRVIASDQFGHLPRGHDALHASQYLRIGYFEQANLWCRELMINLALAGRERQVAGSRTPGPLKQLREGRLSVACPSSTQACPVRPDGCRLIRARLGNAPWDVLHQGIAAHLGISIGTVQIAVSLVVLLAWLPLREMPGLGTLSTRSSSAWQRTSDWPSCPGRTPSLAGSP